MLSHILNEYCRYDYYTTIYWTLEDSSLFCFRPVYLVICNAKYADSVSGKDYCGCTIAVVLLLLLLRLVLSCWGPDQTGVEVLASVLSVRWRHRSSRCLCSWGSLGHSGTVARLTLPCCSGLVLNDCRTDVPSSARTYSAVPYIEPIFFA